MSNNTPDYYAVLGVSRSATTDQIKDAYRKLALEHHPDRVTDDRKQLADKTGESEFHRIGEAYDVLGDSSARLKYDMQMFGATGNPDLDISKDNDYKPLTGEDVNHMLRGLNDYERFTTAHYHQSRAGGLQHNGRRATTLSERKAMRSTKLPPKSQGLSLLAVPLLIVGIWGYNLNTVRKNASRR